MGDMGAGMAPSPASQASGQRWVVFALAWPAERVSRMNWSAGLVRDWLAADGATGIGMTEQDRMAVRQRALDAGLTSQESWLVHGALLAQSRRLIGPGARVAERARAVVGAMAGAEAAQGRSEGAVRAAERFRGQVGTRPRVRGVGRPVAVAVGQKGRSEVEDYAVARHEWAVDDPVTVWEDLVWRDAAGSVMPVGWWGIAADPVLLGVAVGSEQDGRRKCGWQLGDPRPWWADDPGGRKRVMAMLRPFGWSGAPLKADLDEVERHLPRQSMRSKGIWQHMAWLVPTGNGWTMAWQVPNSG
jgi:hypothetical protein